MNGIHDEAQQEWVRLTRADAVDAELARRLHPIKVPPVLWHTCEDGHRWRQQPDGGVSPSYGMALTSIKFDGWDAARCPEPERIALPDDRGLVRGIRCAGCGEQRRPHDLLAGISCTPWELYREFRDSGHVHRAPPPICGKPPVRTLAWSEDVGNWVEVVDGVDAPAGAQLALL
jgi:hypothetical protein